MSATSLAVPSPSPAIGPTIAGHARIVMPVLWAVSLAHLFNDLLQSLVVASYPMLKASFDLTFVQVGMIACSSQITASLLQPLVGWFTDRRPMPYSLCVGMSSTLLGLLALSVATSLGGLMAGAALVGIGSSIFHPESSRITRLASGGRFGFAQSFFQVGGNLGSSLGPLAAALVILPRGQGAIGWFALIAMIAIMVLAMVGRWYAQHQRERAKKPAASVVDTGLPRGKVIGALTVLAILVFSKYCYVASLTSYYTFYLIESFHLSIQAAQLQLFVFLFAVAAGTLVGGPIGDRIGRKRVIWLSILGAAPFALALPWVGLAATEILAALIGCIISSAFSAIVVYAQELVPSRVGMVSGLFFGFAFGVAGLAAAAFGFLADHSGVVEVYRWCAFIPLIGIVTMLLPDLHRGTVRT